MKLVLILKKCGIWKRNNRGVIKLAKERFIQKHGKLFCEVCGFDFASRYGNIDDGYIEGHLTKTLSEMYENEKTNVKDIAFVCANCHRMLHQKRPGLTMSELKKVLM